MSRKENDNDFVATKDEQTFNDEFNKTKLNVIRQIGNKAKNEFSASKLLDSKQKPAKVITLNSNKKNKD
jgi:hypothetical protein